MTRTPPTGPPEAAPPDPNPGPTRGRRRRIVVDARYQLRSGLFVGAIALILLALLNARLVLDRSASAPVAPGEPPAPIVLDRSSLMLAVAGSVVFLAGVVLIGLLESHRTAGAAYAIRRTLDAIREGRSGERVRLRRNDHLRELGDAVNRLAETIDNERASRS